MQMINILILCKEKRNSALLAESICKCTDDSICIIATTDVDEAIEYITKQQITFDLFVISVKLGNRSGYKVENIIRKQRLYCQSPILFMTKDSYSLIGFPYLATYQAYKKCNYLSLPLDKIDIQAKVCLYLDSIAARQNQNECNHYLDVKSVGGIKKVPLKDVLYLEIQDKTCRIYTYQKQYEIKRTSLARVLENLNTSNIVRCHRYFAVNIENIDFIERRDSRQCIIHFTDSPQVCPASRTYLENLAPHYK